MSILNYLLDIRTALLIDFWLFAPLLALFALFHPVRLFKDLYFRGP